MLRSCPILSKLLPNDLLSGIVPDGELFCQLTMTSSLAEIPKKTTSNNTMPLEGNCAFPQKTYSSFADCDKTQRI